MEEPGVLVIGGGISGLALAWKAAKAGTPALVLEARAEVGGAIRTHRGADGHWFELGAHTVYNSYGGFLDLAVDRGLAPHVLERAPARKHFGLLRDGRYHWLTPQKTLFKLNWLACAWRMPAFAWRSKEGVSARTHLSRLLGERTYARLLGPFLAAVPSQSADDFPAAGPGSLFKKRPRREDFPRSLGFDGGLGALTDALAATPGLTVATRTTVTRLARTPGGFAVEAADGRRWEAPRVALAVPPHVAAELLRPDWPALAGILAGLGHVEVESLGVVLPRAEVWLPECAFVVPVDDLFFSAVTRDPFPDPERRAFTFHFRPGVPRERKIARMAELLRVDPARLEGAVEQRVTLPSPRVGHGELVAALDAALAGEALALTGNYFAGLAIEDCVQRSLAEWERIAGA